MSLRGSERTLSPKNTLPKHTFNCPLFLVKACDFKGHLQRTIKDGRGLNPRLPPNTALPWQAFPECLSTPSFLYLKPADTCPATHLSHQAASSQMSHTLLTNLDGPRRVYSIVTWVPSVPNSASKIHLNHPLLGKLCLPPQAPQASSPEV